MRSHLSSFSVTLISFFVCAISDDVPWHFLENFGTDLPADWIAYTGRGATTFAFADFAGSKVSLYSSYYDNNKYSLGKLVEVRGSGSGFANMIDMAGSHLTGDMLFVAHKESDTQMGSVYIFNGRWDRWTQTQQLFPPGKFRSSDFGSSVSLDKVTLSTAVVGCSKCNETINAGQIYVYSSDSSQPRSWSNTQVLSAELFDFKKDPLKITYFLGDQALVDGDVVVGRGLRYNGRDGVLGVVVFTRDTISQVWSQQQVLQMDRDIEGFDVDGHTIVLTVPSESRNGLEGAGAVHVLYPNSKEFTTSGLSSSKQNLHPRGLRWSNQQTLYPNEVSKNGNFGSDISLLGNQLVVGQQGTSTIYVFMRDTVAGRWSSAQTIYASVPMKFFSDNYLYGSSLITVGFPLTNGVPYQPSIELYSRDADWKCLVLSIEDLFGDGWGSTSLQVTTPDGDIDSFYSYCNYPNPLTFRYCPLSEAAAGKYTFAIAKDAVDEMFFWEIQWRVYEESSGQTYIGNFATRMEFSFNESDRTFVASSIVGALSSPPSCTACDQQSGLTLEMMSTGGSQWHSETYEGTTYFISDVDGHKLLQSGAACNNSGPTSTVCRFNLPDGIYTLRIAGDLNTIGAGNSWRFCEVTGDGSSRHVVFEVKGTQCEALAQYTKTKYCADNVQAQAVMEGVIVVKFPTDTSGKSFTAADRAQVAYVLSDQDPLLKVKDVSVTDITSQTVNISVFFSVTVNTASTGCDARDYTAIKDMMSGIASRIELGVDNGSVLAGLRNNGRVPKSTHFLEATRVIMPTNIAIRNRIDLIETISAQTDYEF